MSTSKNKIIPFPKKKKETHPQSTEEYAARAAEYGRKYSQEFCKKLSKIVFSEMARDGIDFEKRSDELMPNSVLVMESILALHLKASGLTHPLQEFAEDAFEEMNDDDDEMGEMDDEENS
jgi:hypothetical protein